MSQLRFPIFMGQSQPMATCQTVPQTHALSVHGVIVCISPRRREKNSGPVARVQATRQPPRGPQHFAVSRSRAGPWGAFTGGLACTMV